MVFFLYDYDCPHRDRCRQRDGQSGTIHHRAILAAKIFQLLYILNQFLYCFNSQDGQALDLQRLENQTKVRIVSGYRTISESAKTPKSKQAKQCGPNPNQVVPRPFSQFLLSPIVFIFIPSTRAKAQLSGSSFFSPVSIVVLNRTKRDEIDDV